MKCDILAAEPLILPFIAVDLEYLQLILPVLIDLKPAGFRRQPVMRVERLPLPEDQVISICEGNQIEVALEMRETLDGPVIQVAEELIGYRFLLF